MCVLGANSGTKFEYIIVLVLIDFKDLLHTAGGQGAQAQPY
jgi:hypothetical protein